MSRETRTVDSPVGEMQIDATGSPVGVARMDVSRSYGGVGELLQAYINDDDQASWQEIKTKIDYTYEQLDTALTPLAEETGMGSEIRLRLDRGQKLLFKPNLVIPRAIEPLTHAAGPMATAATEWPFVAALMRWFHDKMDVRYHQMALGEAGTGMSAMAGMSTTLNPEGKKVTTEATVEGKSGSFYGGWGFYFVRKYLNEALGSEEDDNPMNGYEESVSGTYIPPGRVTDKLMVYDLNRIYDDETKGREVEVPEGVNYKSITLHKVVIGGDPDDAADMERYPGCILVNVPKSKVHAITLFTNIIKNLGIGLYPMQYAKDGGHKWDYSVPHGPIPGMKAGIPHEVWVPDIDMQTGLPKRDSDGKYVTDKCGGITATMIDIVRATMNQGIFMIHVVDGIEAINVDHMGSAAATRVPEGMVFAGLDPVAADLLCARYMFSNVPIKEAKEAGLEDGHGGCFPQAVPVAALDGKQITTQTGFDCPLSRDICFQKAEERGLGERRYYVLGHDTVDNAPLVSIEGHLGRIKEGAFSDLVTEALYFDMFKIPWDLQKTAFSYMDAMDQLTGTSMKKDFLAALDEDGNGIISYEEFGRNGAWSSLLHVAGSSLSKTATDTNGFLKANLYAPVLLKCSNARLNRGGHDLFKEIGIGATVGAALQMSQLEMQMPDPFVPDLTFGNGNWPSFQTAEMFRIGMQVFGDGFPMKPTPTGLYGSALLYADLTQNAGRIAGENPMEPDPAILEEYLTNVSNGTQKPLGFTLYVPEGLETLSGDPLPNVTATDDPAKVFTVSFADGKEVWPEANL